MATQSVSKAAPAGKPSATKSAGRSVPAEGGKSAPASAGKSSPAEVKSFRGSLDKAGGQKAAAAPSRGGEPTPTPAPPPSSSGSRGDLTDPVNALRQIRTANFNRDLAGGPVSGSRPNDTRPDVQQNFDREQGKVDALHADIRGKLSEAVAGQNDEGRERALDNYIGDLAPNSVAQGFRDWTGQKSLPFLGRINSDDTLRAGRAGADLQADVEAVRLD